MTLLFFDITKIGCEADPRWGKSSVVSIPMKVGQYEWVQFDGGVLTTQLQSAAGSSGLRKYTYKESDGRTV